jgi:hypothetical protein
MTRFYLVLGVMFTAFFALMLLTLHLLPPNTTVSTVFGACDMPCWQGVSPGVTGERAALAHLKAAGWVLDSGCNAPVYEACYAFVNDTFDDGSPPQLANLYTGRSQVEQIALLRSNLTLGEVWLHLGTPDYVTLPSIWMNDPAFQMALWFGESGVSARLGFACPQHFGDLLASPVDSLLLWAPGTAMQGTLLGTVGDLRRALYRACVSH